VFDAPLEVGGVEEDVGELLGREVTRAKGRHLGVEVLTDPTHLGLRDAGVDPERPHEVVHLAGGDPVIVKPP